MDKNQVIELIKQNRLGEAIELIEKASSGTDLHTDIIMLASAYSDYAKKNRHATHDINTLEAKRNRITHQLLAYLDEVPADALASMSPPPAQPAASSREREPIAAGPAAAFPTNPPGAAPKPWLKYALIGGGIGAAILAFFVMTEPADEYYYEDEVAATAPLPDYEGDAISSPTQDYDEADDLSAEQATTSPTESENMTSAETVEEIEPESINAYMIEFIEMDAGHGSPSTIVMEGEGVWLETHPNGDTHYFREEARDEWSVYLRDDERGVTLQLDINLMEVLYSDDNDGTRRKLYNILSYGTYE